MSNTFLTFLSGLVASRVLVDEIRIPEEFYEKVKPSFEEIEKWTGLFSGIEADKPHTWVRSGIRVADMISENNKPKLYLQRDIIHTAMSELDYMVSEFPSMKNIFFRGLSLAEMTLVYEKNDRVFFRIELPCKHKMFLKTTKSFISFEESQNVEMTFYTPADDKARRDVYASIGDLFWRQTKNILLDKGGWSSTLLFSEVQECERPYRGNALEYVDQWDKFMRSNVRRCVLLQGPPGTGKSTLVRHASRQLSKRTIHLSQDLLEDISRETWSFLIRSLRPEIVVVDDVDRIGEYEMSKRLYMFEDHYHQVPLTLLTANHYEELPDAFLRPGRIDQIVELDDPKDSVKIEVIKQLAAQEGVFDIPDDSMKTLLSIYKKHTGAYTVEYIRRFKVLGWDYIPPRQDLTFNTIDEEEENNEED